MGVSKPSEVKERPILMHVRSVCGILEGRKTQTRRAVKPQPQEVGYGRDCTTAPYCTGTTWPLAYYEMRGACWNSSEPLKCPYGKPGERLWVRETWQARKTFDTLSPAQIGKREGSDVLYLADDTVNSSGCRDHFEWGKTRSPIHMPRWASRLTLEITDIRVERVQDISAADCFAEGIDRPSNYPLPGLASSQRHGIKQYFGQLWDETNGKGAWVRNDWVWVISFKKASAYE